MSAKYYQICQPHTGENASRALMRDIATHLEARQHAEKSIVLCANPQAMLSGVRKHWFKLARAMQKQRSSTLNADKILRFTHAISHMQFVDFTMKPPSAAPAAQVYFMQPNNLTEIPMNCFTVYLVAPIDTNTITRLTQELPNQALLVDHVGTPSLADFGLLPKDQLEQETLHAWNDVTEFLKQYDINIGNLANQDQTTIEEALDRVLGAYNAFLQVAGRLQRSIDLAQPITFNHLLKRQFELCSMLAYRVHSLTHSPATPSPFEFAADYGFFLHDPSAEAMHMSGFFAPEVRRHQLAGRFNLAKALQRSGGLRLLNPQSRF